MVFLLEYQILLSKSLPYIGELHRHTTVRLKLEQECSAVTSSPTAHDFPLPKPFSYPIKETS